MTERLDQLLAEHLAEVFPASVEKGLDYGDVEPVSVDADIYGWVLTITEGSSLGAAERQRLRKARNDLKRSLHLLPDESISYFRRLLALADAAIAAESAGEH